MAEKTITNLFSIKGLYAENPVFYDANNNVINEIGKNEYIVAKINVGNVLESKQNVMLVAAVHENSGRLLYVNSEIFTIDGNDEKILNIVVDEKPLGDINLFCWTGDGSITPINEVGKLVLGGD